MLHFYSSTANVMDWQGKHKNSYFGAQTEIIITEVLI